MGDGALGIENNFGFWILDFRLESKSRSWTRSKLIYAVIANRSTERSRRSLRSKIHCLPCLPCPPCPPCPVSDCVGFTDSCAIRL